MEANLQGRRKLEGGADIERKKKGLIINLISLRFLSQK